MEPRVNTGWRKLPKHQYLLTAERFDAKRADLFLSKRLAERCLDLDKASIAVLGAMISFFKEPLNGRIIVWPSNEALMTATGYSERSIRSSIRNLTLLGLLLAKDSANGKRFAIRSKSGQIIDAYGFDLSPLVDRRGEFEKRAEEIEILRQARRREWDEITVLRRSTNEVLLTISEWFPEIDTDALWCAFEGLKRDTPRRSLDRAPGSSLSQWRVLKEQAESLYNAARPGNDCRHIENNNETSDQSCQSGQEEMRGRNRVSIGEIKSACPDAFGYSDGVSTEAELVKAAARLRGAFGTHESAWREACDGLGLTAAAATFFFVLQLYDEDQRGKRIIQNFGGLFRVTARRFAAGEISLADELAKMRRRRQN